MNNTIVPYEQQYFIDTTKPVWNYSLFTDEAVIDFQQGKNYALYYTFGSRLLTVNNTGGYYFALWAPNALQVTVISDFTGWNNTQYTLIERTDGSGIWEGFIPNFPEYMQYKYHLHCKNGITIDKGDPFAYRWQLRPNTSSITQELTYTWSDTNWIKKRAKHNSLTAPWRDRKSTRLNSSHVSQSRMPSSA